MITDIDSEKSGSYGPKKQSGTGFGLPLIEADTDKIAAGDQLEVDLPGGVINNLTQNIEITFKPFPAVMQKLLEDGGLVAHLKKHGGFQI